MTSQNSMLLQKLCFCTKDSEERKIASLKQNQEFIKRHVSTYAGTYQIRFIALLASVFINPLDLEVMTYQ